MNMRTAVRWRWLIVAIALIAGIAFAISVWGGRWWVIVDAEVGPYGAKRCFDKSCEPAGLNWLGGGERWMRIGMATWAAGLISTFLLVVQAAGVAARRVPRLVAKMVLVSTATAAIVGGWFLVGFPSADFPAATIDRGAVVFIAGVILGALSAVFVLRTPR
jgi:hypothetical protein